MSAAAGAVQAAPADQAERPWSPLVGPARIGSVNAPWWRLTDPSRQTTDDRSIRVESDDDSADLLPPFYD